MKIWIKSANQDSSAVNRHMLICTVKCVTARHRTLFVFQILFRIKEKDTYIKTSFTIFFKLD